MPSDFPTTPLELEELLKEQRSKYKKELATYDATIKRLRRDIAALEKPTNKVSPLAKIAQETARLTEQRDGLKTKKSELEQTGLDFSRTLEEQSRTEQDAKKQITALQKEKRKSQARGSAQKAELEHLKEAIKAAETQQARRETEEKAEQQFQNLTEQHTRLTLENVKKKAVIPVLGAQLSQAKREETTFKYQALLKKADERRDEEALRRIGARLQQLLPPPILYYPQPIQPPPLIADPLISHRRFPVRQ